MALGGSTLFSLTWNDAVTPSGRRICARRASALRTSDSGCTSWPTPTVSRGDYSYANGDHETPTLKLAGAAKTAVWPTPLASDGTASRETFHHGPNNPMLLGAARTAAMVHPGGKGLEVQRVEHARRERPAAERSGETEPLADSRRARARNGRATRGHDQEERDEGATDPARSGGAGVLADAPRGGRRQGRQAKGGDRPGSADNGGRSDTSGILGDPSVPGAQAQDQGDGYPHRRVCDLAIPAGATGGFWADADWVLCRDPSGGPPVARPVEPGTFPLVAGLPGRVGLLRGYGNSIVPQVAVEFIVASLEAIAQQSA